MENPTTRPTAMRALLAAVAVASLVLAGCSGGGGSGDNAAADGQLSLGSLMPETGNLAFLGPPLVAGLDLAIEEINEAGGVAGSPVAIDHLDSGDDSSSLAAENAQELIDAGVSVILGPAASGVALSVIDQITGSGVLQISPSNTSPAFSTYEGTDGLYFRTAPSDALQGSVLGEVVVADDGHDAVAILALQDSYGEGLEETVRQAVEAAGGTVVRSTIYDPQAGSFAADVAATVTAQPDALVLAGFDEAYSILPELEEQGIGPRDIAVYFVDGNLVNYGEDMPAGFLDGSKGTRPGQEIPDEFVERLLGINPDLNEFTYTAESYDATILVALAAVAGGSVQPRDIADHLVDVSGEGTPCSGFADCRDLLEAGENIDYEGVSGPINFAENGDVSEATIGVFQYDEDNNFAHLDSRSGTF
jgi:ABC-type branched-subunit amino acid transport system substrate-binding protein